MGFLYGSIIPDDLNTSIENVKKYIIKNKNNNKDIRIFSIGSMFYTLELNIDNGYFDMPLNGNMGKNGDDKLIKKIKELKTGTLLLMENEEVTKYKTDQFPINVRNFVNNNYNKIEQIENFDVYEIKN